MLEKCPVCEWKPIAGPVCPNCQSDLAPLLRAIEGISRADAEARRQAARTRRLLVALPAAAFAAGLVLMAWVRPAAMAPRAVAGPAATAPKDVVAPAVAAPAQPAPAVVYTVRAGDSLWKIARRAYGQAALWPQLQQSNPQLEPSRALHAGEQIRLYPITLVPAGVK